MRIHFLLSLLFGFTLVAGAHAAESSAAPDVPAAQSFHLGALQVTALHDGQIVLPNNGKVFGGDVGVQAVAGVLRAAGAPEDSITLSLNSLLVRTGKRLALIDTGLGPARHSHLLASLKLAGVAPDRITDILITHPHPDHTGGLLDAQGGLQFPNATIHMSQDAWAAMKQRATPDAVKALTAKIRTFEPGAQVLPGIVSVSLPGHAPGNVGYQIGSGHARLFDISDVVHSSIVSLAQPKWRDGFDQDHDLARETRLQTLAGVAKSHEWVYAPHFPFPAVGHIVASGKGYVWKPGLP
jgi:glyoxylase-like metal-dependent hydrolase (beta-lactamase superfamily II)